MERLADLRIREFTHWTYYIEDNQCYLGNSYLRLKRKAGGVSSLKGIEWLELRRAMVLIERVLTQIWRPQLFVWSTPTTISLTCHFYCNPQYNAPIEFAGVEFPVLRLGAKKVFFPEEDILTLIRDRIRQEFQSVHPVVL